MSDEEIGELDGALRTAKRAGGTIPGLTRAQFPLPKLGDKLHALRRDIMHGRGFRLVRGLPVDRCSAPDAAMIYWIEQFKDFISL
ncbi:MAG TPA: hypothetical protein PK177_10980, partial [Burkholderiaceae bacterium]|nr:hypothetical protein [Burkholderiaceae bacterium]